MYLCNTFYSAYSHTTVVALNLCGLPLSPVTHLDLASLTKPSHPSHCSNIFPLPPCAVSPCYLMQFSFFWFVPPHRHAPLQSPSLKSPNAHPLVCLQHTLSLTNGASTELFRAVPISYQRSCNRLLKDTVGILVH